MRGRASRLSPAELSDREAATAWGDDGSIAHMISRRSGRSAHRTRELAHGIQLVKVENARHHSTAFDSCRYRSSPVRTRSPIPAWVRTGNAAALCSSSPVLTKAVVRNRVCRMLIGPAIPYEIDQRRMVIQFFCGLDCGSVKKMKPRARVAGGRARALRRPPVQKKGPGISGGQSTIT